MRYLMALIFGIALFTSCGDNSQTEQLLVGDWQGTEWLIEGKASNNDASKVTFAFDPTGSYNAQFGNTPEKGTYRVSGDKLYTKEEGKQEIMVKIANITADSLVIDMNRGGQAETLIFAKQ